MPQIKFPQGKDATIVDDDGRIWRIGNPKGRRDVAPKGMEFYQKPDSTLGMRRTGQRSTEYERLREGLPEGARAAADSVELGLKARAKAASVVGTGKGPSQTVRLPIEPGAADSVDVKIEKPADLKALDELREKRRNRGVVSDAAKRKALDDREDRILTLLKAAGETKLNEITGEVEPKYGKDHRGVLEGLLTTEYLEYQKAVGTDGIAIQGGPGIPGTQSNPYLPSSKAQMESLEPGDYFVDPKGDPRRWEGKEVRSGEPPKKPKPSPRPKQKEPPVKPKAHSAGGFPKKSSKVEEELRTKIKRITTALEGTDIGVMTRARFEKRLEELQAKLDAMTK